MALTNYNRSPVLCRRLADSGAFTGQPFHLFDVGVSGGIDGHWRRFASDLRVWGFDPLVAEVERLNGQAKPGEFYEAAFVGSPEYREKYTHDDWWTVESRTNQSFGRTSAAWAQQFLQMDWTKEVYNHDAEVVFADRVVSLDSYCREQAIDHVDFLKIDTDGSDFEVLDGSRGLLRSGGLLGLQVEAQFHGAVHSEANLFANIDCLLRQNGFSLFDLDLWRYSRASLPRPFFYDIAGQTTQGQIAWGEALYLRDLGDPIYEQKWPDFEVSIAAILKTIALFDMFNLQDCAVEVLLKYAGRLTEAGWNAEELADMVVPEVDGKRVGLKEFIAHCEGLVRQRRFKSVPG